tara:strand:+ start:122 stop:553 length:432 start_codon:yes stop_codon:yes gene_type:complete
MSTALQFTAVFDPTNPPQKLSNGGMGMKTTPVAASKALEAKGIKTQAIKDLETPPPVSLADANPILVPNPQREELLFRPQDLTLPEKPMFYETKQEVPMNPELLMVMNSLKNMGGIMATPMREETGLAALANMTYGDNGKIPV